MGNGGLRSGCWRRWLLWRRRRGRSSARRRRVRQARRSSLGDGGWPRLHCCRTSPRRRRQRRSVPFRHHLQRRQCRWRLLRRLLLRHAQLHSLADVPNVRERISELLHNKMKKQMGQYETNAQLSNSSGDPCNRPISACVRGVNKSVGDPWAGTDGRKGTSLEMTPSLFESASLMWLRMKRTSEASAWVHHRRGRQSCGEAGVVDRR